MADEILVQISEAVTQSSVLVTDSGDQLAVDLVEQTTSYATSVSESVDEYTVDLQDAGDDVVVNLTAPVDDIVVNLTDGGGSGIYGGVFVTDATPLTGVVGAKVFTPDSKELVSCSADHDTVRIVVGCEGGIDEYTPAITVAGLPVVLTESATKRWFTGYADVALDTGDNEILVSSSTGSTAAVTVTLRGAGPAVTGIVIGAYPGVQTQLKAGDVVGVTITTEPDAVSVTITGGSTCSSPTFPVSGGTATGTITIGAGSGSLTFSAIAQNDFGTPGLATVSPPLTLNQTYPTFSAFSVTYPVGQGALSVGQTATIACTVSNADTAGYSGVGLDVTDTSATATSSAYVVTGTNYTITANRAANDATASASALVKLATAAPTAAITTVPSGRMVTSPGGTDYEVRITPSQQLSAAPSLFAPAGVWQGSWTSMGSYWKRSLRVTDADARGVATFTNLTLSSLSLTAGNVITSGQNYTIGGMSERTLTVPAFSRVVALGAAVADQTKTYAAIVGGNVMVRQTDTSVVMNGYFIANADGSYNPNGTYLGISDSAFAGANTGGTLQLTFREDA